MIKKELLLGIDIGGTNTVIGFVDLVGRLLQEASIPTRADEPVSVFIPRLSNKINEVYTKLTSEYELNGIGIAAPSANYFQGTILSPSNLNWGNVDFVQLMKQNFDVPIALTNDANAAALGEYYYGAAKNKKNFIVITLGTGMGSGIMVDGRIIYGENGLAGELGHTKVESGGRKCRCGQEGCLEAYVSATGLRRTVFNLLCHYTEDSKLRSYSFQELTAEKISEFACEKDFIAMKAFDYTGNILGRKLADITASFSPEVIILFGGLANSGELLLKPTHKYFEDNLLNVFKGKVRIIKSKMKNGRAAVLGASSLLSKCYQNGK